MTLQVLHNLKLLVLVLNKCPVLSFERSAVVTQVHVLYCLLSKIVLRLFEQVAFV